MEKDVRINETEFGAETKTSLAAKYGTDPKTMGKWLLKIGYAEPGMGGYIYTPEEVEIIVKKLGKP